MAHRSRDGRKSNTDIFLWHPVFDQAEATRFEATAPARQTERNRTGCPPLTRHERQGNANLTEHLRHPNQEELNQKLESLAHQGSGRLVEREQPGARTEVSAAAAPINVSKGFVHPSFTSGNTWPVDDWPSEADFDAWWERLVWQRPNRHHNSTARAKAIELVWNGTLNRKEFDEGYSRLKASSAARWATENGRYARNLVRLLEDSMWKYAPAEPLALGGYKNANDYLRGMENE